MKSKVFPFVFSFFGQYNWLAYSLLILLSASFLATTRVSGQTIPGQQLLSQKALLFKNRVEYDSALYYNEKLGELFVNEGDKKAEIHNRINISDLLVLQRDFTAANHDLKIAEIEIENGFAGDVDLMADFLQVKGSFLFATGNPDSAKFYLEKSIGIRIAKYGIKDTSLHYAYNKLGNLFIAQSDFAAAYDYHNNALDISLKKQNPINYLTASSYQNLGIVSHMKGDYQHAEECYTKSLELKEQLFNYNDPALAKIYGNLGKFFTDLSKYDTALNYYDKAEKVLISKYDRNNLQFAYIYWNKGNVYTHKGDYVKATSYLSKAQTLLETNLGPGNQDALRMMLDLGFAYDKKGDTQIAIDYYNRAAKNNENAGIIKIYRNLGNIYKEINMPDSAEKYYQLSILFAKKIFAGNSYDLALCYQYYGEFLEVSGRHDNNSLWYYSQAAEIFIQLFGGKNKDLSKVYRLQSGYFLSKNEYDSALNKIQSSLVALLPGFSELDPYKNPSFDEIILDIYLQDALQQKAITHYLKYKQSKNPRDLYASLDIIDLTIAVTEEIRKTYNDEESQLILNKSARNIIDLGLLATLELYSEKKDDKFLKKAFYYSEKGKAIILLGALRGLEAQSNTNIPENMRKLESKLSIELATYNNLLYQEQQRNNPDKSKIKLWSDEIFNLRLTYDSILASYKMDYPEYFRLKFDYSIRPADSVLSSLPEDQAILEYCLTDSLIVGLLLSNNKLYAEILGEKIDVLRNLDSLRQNFSQSDYFNAGQKEFKALTSVSANLYDILIRPFEKDITGKRLIIIPDGELGYLSFDLLLKEKPPDSTLTYQNLPWLIRDNPISYSSSATIHFEQSNRVSKKVSGNLLAFAPSYNFINNHRNADVADSIMLKLSPIVGTKEEINSISSLFHTKKLFDEKATETYFKEHAGNYGILHLAMHTIIDNENPLYSKLVFTPGDIDSPDDGYLNTYELFGLHLPGQLAVLSACNTGSGKLERGEGIISLARGFFYAGIPSVVMTLWEIEDHSSADLMSIFYENLKKGYPNDIALQLAKIAYLEKSGKLHSHPYFWAGYVSIGKISPVEFKPSVSAIYFVLAGFAILLLIMLIYFFINRRVFLHKKRY